MPQDPKDRAPEPEAHDDAELTDDQLEQVAGGTFNTAGGVFNTADSSVLGDGSVFQANKLKGLFHNY